MNAMKWMVSALAVLVLVGVCVAIGMTLLPPHAVAESKGTVVPWFFVWGMIWATVAMGVVVAGHMVGVGLGKISV